MTEPTKYYTEQEKEFFMNHFILKNDSCKIKFESYLCEFIKNSCPEAKDVHERVILAKMFNYRYNSHHYKWDSNDNLVTYILSHPKFIPTKGRLRDINKLHPDWNYANKKGDTPLHLLAAKHKLDLIKKISRDFPLNFDAKNDNNDYFTFNLINKNILIELTKNQQYRNEDVLFSFLSNIPKTLKIYEQHINHFENSSKDKINELVNKTKELKNQLYLMCENYPDNNGIKKEDMIKFLENSFAPLESFINFHHLNKNLTKNDTKRKVNKV